MTKEKVKDIAIRVLKTFIAAGLVAVVGLGFDNPKTWIITFATSGVTAVMNLAIKLLEKDNEDV